MASEVAPELAQRQGRRFRLVPLDSQQDLATVGVAKVDGQSIYPDRSAV
jgi:hypothetical protein